MKKILFVLVSSVLLLTSGMSVFAEGEKIILTNNPATHEFQQVNVEKLTAIEKAFVEIAKEHTGVHKFGSLYVIALGQRPNAGYGINFVKQEQILEQLKIHVQETLPEQNKVYPEVITYPYIVGRVDLPKYTTLSILNAENKKPLFDENHFKLTFSAKQFTRDNRPIWAVKTEMKITKADLGAFKISLKKLGQDKEIPITLSLDSKSKNKIFVRPNERLKKGETYLLQTVKISKTDTAMSVMPFELK